MTQEEIKAKELIQDHYNILDNYSMSKAHKKEYAVKHALYTLQQKENTLLSCIGDQKHFWTSDEKEAYDFLQSVRTHIEQSK